MLRAGAAGVAADGARIACSSSLPFGGVPSQRAAAASRASSSSSLYGPAPRRAGGLGFRRHVFNSGARSENTVSFYDHSIEKYALMEGQPLSLAEMLSFGRQCAGVPALWNKAAAHVQSELPIRLARRLMDLQFLPYVVVTNPHVLKVYKAVRLGPPAHARARAPTAGAGPGLTAASTTAHRARPPRIARGGSTCTRSTPSGSRSGSRRRRTSRSPRC